jgi:hypothetical protein
MTLACATCHAPRPPYAIGWWRTSTLVLCPGCYVRLSEDEEAALAETLHPIEEATA